MQERRSRWIRLGVLACALAGWVVAVPARVMAGPVVKQSCDSSCSSEASCTFDGVKNVALGRARMSINKACNLVVDGIGSSAEDGFSQPSLPRDTGAVVTNFACPNFSDSQAGDKETVTFYADVPGGVFYTMTIENIGKRTLEMRPDFSPIGATRYSVTVLNDGRVNRIYRDLPSATFRMNQGDQKEVN